MNRMKELGKRQRKRKGAAPDVSSIQEDDVDVVSRGTGGGEFKPKGLDRSNRFMLFSVIGVVAIVWQ